MKYEPMPPVKRCVHCQTPLQGVSTCPNPHCVVNKKGKSGGCLIFIACLATGLVGLGRALFTMI